MGIEITCNNNPVHGFYKGPCRFSCRNLELYRALKMDSFESRVECIVMYVRVLQ